MLRFFNRIYKRENELIMNIKHLEEVKIDLPIEVKEWLQEQAKTQEISDEEFINKVLADYVKENNPEDKKEDKLEIDIDNNDSYKGIIDELLEIIRKF